MYITFEEDIDNLVVEGIENCPTDDWVKIQIITHILGEYGDWEIYYWEKGGTDAIPFDLEFEDDGDELLGIANYIRCEMYKANINDGTWFTMDINFGKDLDVAIEFLYDKPYLFAESEEPSDEDYKEEWEQFPRKKENTPDWLLEKWQKIGIEVKD